MRRKNVYYRALCATRFVEHFANAGLDQSRYDASRFARWREALVQRAYPEAAEGAGPGPTLALPEYSDAASFVAAIPGLRSPAVLRGGARAWPCARRWNLDYFREHCARTAVFNISDHITEQGSVLGRTDLADVIDRFGQGGQYARFVPIIHEFPQVLQDLDMGFCTAVIGGSRHGVKLWGEGGKGVSIRSHLFLGEAGTRTNTHCELTNNLFVNASGRKEWIVCPPDYLFALRSPVTKNPGVFGSRYLDDASQAQRYPLAERLPKYRFVLEPGDVMFLPAFFWHEVRNLTANISLGLRWYAFGDAMRSSRTLNLLSLMATRPTMRAAIRHATQYGQVHGEN